METKNEAGVSPICKLPVQERGRLAKDLLRYAAEVLGCAGKLTVLDVGWVDRHVRVVTAGSERSTPMEIQTTGDGT